NPRLSVTITLSLSLGAVAQEALSCHYAGGPVPAKPRAHEATLPGGASRSVAPGFRGLPGLFLRPPAFCGSSVSRGISLDLWSTPCARGRQRSTPRLPSGRQLSFRPLAEESLRSAVMGQITPAATRVLWGDAPLPPPYGSEWRSDVALSLDMTRRRGDTGIDVCFPYLG